MLTPKQQRFVAEYLIDLNATQAAIRAGYSRKTAEQIGYENLRKHEIAAAVAAGQAKRLTSADLTATRVLEELRRLAFSDLRGVFDDGGNLKPITEWTDDQGAALASVEVIIKNAKAGDGVVDTIHKIRVWDKTKALDILAKHFGLLKENVEHHGEINIRWAS
jgi:phage terminase small subunit